MEKFIVLFKDKNYEILSTYLKKRCCVILLSSLSLQKIILIKFSEKIAKVNFVM